MSLYKLGISFVLLLISFNSQAEDNNLGADMRPSLGQVAMDYEGSIVSPDGSGLPVGSGSVSDGKAIFEMKCLACHGPAGEQPGNQIAGGIGSLPTMRPLKTVGSFWPYATTLYDYVARAMPYNQEKSLSPDEVYAVTAYVLNLSGIVGESDVLDQQSLVEVEMPNRDGFIELIR